MDYKIFVLELHNENAKTEYLLYSNEEKAYKDLDNYIYMLSKNERKELGTTRRYTIHNIEDFDASHRAFIIMTGTHRFSAEDL